MLFFYNEEELFVVSFSLMCLKTEFFLILFAGQSKQNHLMKIAVQPPTRKTVIVLHESISKAVMEKLMTLEQKVEIKEALYGGLKDQVTVRCTNVMKYFGSSAFSGKDVLSSFIFHRKIEKVKQDLQFCVLETITCLSKRINEEHFALCTDSNALHHTGSTVQERL